MVFLGDAYEWDVVGLESRRNLAGEESAGNSSLVLAARRTRRRDPTNNFERYTGGWNISNDHYWAVSLAPISGLIIMSLGLLLLLFFFFIVPGSFFYCMHL